MKLWFLCILIFVAGCIYETPQAVETGQKEFNSVADTFGEQVLPGPEEFSLRLQVPNAHTIKGVQNIADECGCMEYITAAASSMIRFRPELTVEEIIAFSGALRLEDRQTTFERFFIERVPQLGFNVTFVVNEPNQNVVKLLDRSPNEPIRIAGPGRLQFLKVMAFSNAVPLVALDRHFIFDEKLRRYGKENDAPEHEQFFAQLVGYDSNIRINDPTIQSIAGAYRDIAKVDFMNAWESPADGYGETFAILILPEGEPLGKEERLRILVKDLRASQNNIRVKMEESRKRQAAASRRALATVVDQDSATGLRTSARLFLEMDEKDLNTARNDIIRIEKELVETLR